MSCEPLSLQGVLNQVRSYLWIPVAQDAYRRISMRVFRHMLDLDLNFHLHKKTGEVTKMVRRGEGEQCVDMAYLSS